MKSGVCICMKKVNQDDIDVVKCEVCAMTMHFKCYMGNDDSNLELTEGLCITCTVNKINPFESVESIYLNPVIMPKKPDLKTGKISGSFILIEDIIKKIKTEGNYKIFLYSVLHDTRFLTEKNYLWPEGFDIFFNNHKLKHTNFEPIDITRFARVNSNSLEFQYKQIYKDYVLFVLGSKPVTPKELYETLEQYRQYSVEECKQMICTMLENCGIEKENISLKCTFSAGIMNTPVRGKLCQHINCFDLNNYITYAKSTKKWRCPICKNLTYFKDLYIDTFIKSIIDEFRNNKKDFDSYSIIIDREGKKKYEKYENKYSLEKNNYFSENASKFLEQLNYSPKRSLKDIQMDLEKDESDPSESDKEIEYLTRLEQVYAKMINNDEPFDKILIKLKTLGFIKELSIKNLITFLSQFSLKPNRSQNIFPTFTIENSTSMYYQKCDKIYQKFGNFNKIICLWSLNFDKLINLTIDLSIHKSNDHQNETSDHYFSLELLISLAYNLHLQNNEFNIEYLIGKLTGLYCKSCHFNEIQIAHVIDQITVLFPSFYFPKTDFSTDRDQKDYFDKMVLFFQGILCEFSATVSGKILKKVISPIKNPISNLSDIEICYIKLIEDLFFNNLFQKLEYTSFNRGLFLLEYDIFGYFREFLRIHDKLFKYGFEYDNKGEIIEISSNGNISNLFKLQERDIGSNSNQTLTKLLNR